MKPRINNLDTTATAVQQESAVPFVCGQPARESSARLLIHRMAILFLLLLASVPSFSQSTELFSGTFSTSNQSMWSNGTATTLTYSYNPSFSVDTGTNTFGGINSHWWGKLGAQVTERLYGSAGLSANFGVSAGTAAASLPATFTLQHPNAVQTGTFSINSGVLFNTGSLSTQSPYAYTNAGLSLKAGYYLKGEGCIGGCVTAGPYSGDWNKQANLWNLDSNSISKKYSLDNGNVTLDFNAPKINTTGSGNGVISSSGQMTTLKLGANISHYASDLLGIPLDWQGGNCSFACASYNILSATGSLSTDIGQKFTLDPHALVELDAQYFGASNNFLGSKSFLEPAGDNFNLQMPGGVDHMLITPDYLMTANLTNETYLALYAGLSISGGSGKACGLGNCSSFGPLFSYNKTFDLGKVDLYDQEFGLGGWNFFQGAQFRIDNDDTIVTCATCFINFNLASSQDFGGTPTPEPTNLLLLGTGLLGLCGTLRKKLGQ